MKAHIAKTAAASFVLLSSPAARPNDGLAQNRPAPDAILNRKVSIEVTSESFAHILSELHERYGLQVAADGIPRTAGASLKFDGDLHSFLDRVCDVFDYTWTAGQGESILLRKRFQRPEERPQFTLPENRQSAKDMLEVLPVNGADITEDSWQPLFDQLASSLTNEQRAALRAGSAISGKNLFPAQRNLLSQLISARGFGPAAGVLSVTVFVLKNAERSRITVTERQPSSDGPDTLKISLVARDQHGLEVARTIGYLAGGGKPQ